MLAAALAAAAAAQAGNPEEMDSARMFNQVPEDHADLPQPMLTPHSSSADIGFGFNPASSSPPPPLPPRPPPDSPPTETADPSPLPAPLRLSLVLRKGVHLSARLTPRFLTVLRPRRMAIMDDVKLTVDIRDASARVGEIVRLRLEAATLMLCPGYSRSLRARLPPSAPSTRRPKKPGLLRYWECAGSLRGINARLSPPGMPRGDGRGVEEGGGLFARVSSFVFDACGMAADERQEAMSKASFHVDSVYAGSNAVENSAQERCESLAQFAPPLPAMPSSPRSRSPVAEPVLGDYGGEEGDGSGDEDECEEGNPEVDYRPPPLDPEAVEVLESFIALRPEAVLWLAGLNAAFDMNCAKRDAMRLDVSGDGAVMAIEPAGLLRILRNSIAFSRAYTSPPREVMSPHGFDSPVESLASPRSSPGFPAASDTTLAPGLEPLLPPGQGLGGRSTSAHSAANLSRSASLDSEGSGGLELRQGGARLFGCDLQRCHVIILGDGPVGTGDTLALIFGAEKITVPRMIRSCAPGGGFRVAAKVENLRVDHWTQWARTSNLVCEHGSFNNISRSNEERREVEFAGLAVDWDLDLQSALEELPDRFIQLAKVKHDAALAEYTRSLFAKANGGTPASSSASASASAASLRDGYVSPPVPLAGVSFAHSSAAKSPPPALPGIEPGSSQAGLMKISPSHTQAVLDADALALIEVEKRERRERRRKRFLRMLDVWVLSGTDVRVAASFPDGPRFAGRAAEVPSFCLSDRRYSVRDVLFSLSRARVMYAEELSVLNPIHSMGRLSLRRHVDIAVHGFRACLPHEYWFGFLLQDWLLRLKAVLKVSREARYRRRGLPMPRYRKKPFPDLHLSLTDLEIAFADHPIDAFLCKALPLMQDEALEREKRYNKLADAVTLMNNSNSSTPSGIRRLKSLLAEENSAIYIHRMKSHMASLDQGQMAQGFLPDLSGPPQSVLKAASVRFDMKMDDATRKNGSAESMRKLKKYDTYLLGPQKEGKTRQYEARTWNSIGFRNIDFDARAVSLSFRDYPRPFLTIDRLCCEKGAIVGQGQENMAEPNVTETTVAIGRRQMVRVVKTGAPTKVFLDLHLIADVMEVHYNPSYLGAVIQFGRSFGRLLSGGKNPSPRMAWWDSMRLNNHGVLRITTRTLQGIMSSSISPYTETNHFVKIVAENVCMLMSRRPATAADPHVISWTLHNWLILPSIFRNDLQSYVKFKYVRVGMKPVPQCASGDPQDHYIFPLVTKEEVEADGPGIGRALMIPFTVDLPVVAALNVNGCYTAWTSPLLTDGNPDYDSYADFRLTDYHLDLSIEVRHSPGVLRPSSKLLRHAPEARLGGSRATKGDPQMFWYPDGSSIMHSDAVTTVRRVVDALTARPPSNRAPPRWIFPGRKPGCPTYMYEDMMSLDLDVVVDDVNVMLYNNFDEGHGLFVSVESLRGSLSRASTRIVSSDPGLAVGAKTSRTVRRSVKLRDLYTAIRVPGLDFSDEATGCGFLFSLASLELFRDDDDVAGNRRSQSYREPSSGFGSHRDTSPFYTFSASHMLQRDKKLDVVVYKQLLAIDGIRLFWSPMRRNSALAWPNALASKNFSMKGVGRDNKDRIDPLVETFFLAQREEGPDGIVFEEESSAKGAHRTGSDSAALPFRDAAELNSVAPDSDGIASRDADTFDRSPTDSRPLDLAVASGSDSKIGTFRVLSKDEPAVVVASKRPGGDLFDLIDPLLAPDIAQRRPNVTNNKDGPSIRPSDGRVGAEPYAPGLQAQLGDEGENFSSNLQVLDTTAKFELLVTDSQVCFGAPDADALVVLTSESASIGFVDKTIEQKHQLGGSSEKWIDAEYRVFLQRSRLYTQSEALESFKFHERWVPKEADVEDDPQKAAAIIHPLTRVTVEPISFNVMYIQAKSLVKSEDDTAEDNVLRPAQLFINVPYVSMDSSRTGFHSVTDVVRQVLMLRIPNSEVIKEELALLKYNMQLAGRVSPEELMDYGRRLDNITKQFLYAGETFQPHLVEAFIREEDGDFDANFIRYKARAKAVATYLRSERRATGAAELFPTLYISYSFDQCSWKLRDLKTMKPFVELIMTDLVCRHILYVGKGMSSEFTFGNINAINHQEGGYYRGILHPSGGNVMQGAPVYVNSKIKASDGTSVAFRWFAQQMESVGGIPVYDVLTINVSPLNAAISSNLYKAVAEFAFGTSEFSDLRKMVGKKNVATADSAPGPPSASSSSAAVSSELPSQDLGIDSMLPSTASVESVSGGEPGRARRSRAPGKAPGSNTVSSKRPPSLRRKGGTADARAAPAASTTASVLSAVSGPLHARTRSQDVLAMNERGQSTMIFKYVYIGEFQLTASYKKKEDPDAHSVLDITDLTVNTPSYMYSSKIWSWRDFAKQIKNELLVSFAVRGVSNLAKIKLLPGYQFVRRRVKQGTDTVNGIRHGIFDRSQANSSATGSVDGGDDDVPQSVASFSDDGEADDGEVSENVKSIANELQVTSSEEEEKRRKLLLDLLFGPRTGARLSSAETRSLPNVEGRYSTANVAEAVTNPSEAEPMPSKSAAPLHPASLRTQGRSFLRREKR